MYECMTDGESIGPCMNRRTRIRSEYAVTNSWRGPGRGDPSLATEMRVMQNPGSLFQVTKDHRRSQANDAREGGACALAMKRAQACAGTGIRDETAIPEMKLMIGA